MIASWSMTWTICFKKKSRVHNMQELHRACWARIRHKVGPWREWRASSQCQAMQVLSWEPFSADYERGDWPTICRQTFFEGSGIDSSAEKCQHITPNLALIWSQHESPCHLPTPLYLWHNLTVCNCQISHSFLTQFYSKISLPPSLFCAHAHPFAPQCASRLSRDALWITPLCIFQLCCPLNSSHHCASPYYASPHFKYLHHASHH